MQEETQGMVATSTLVAVVVLVQQVAQEHQV
jgi:hypothetical protein